MSAGAGTELTDWLLTKAERANEQTVLDAHYPGEQAWSGGNHVRPLVHGATYFAELADRIAETRAGDLIYFTDWRGDPDEQLTDDPNSTMEELLSAADVRGVDVRGLIWRSHLDILSFSSAENRQTGEQLQSNGAEVLLDMRVRTGGSHHQKLVVIRYRDRPDRRHRVRRRASTCATPGGTTPGIWATRSPSRWRRRTATDRPGTTSRPPSPVRPCTTSRRSSANAGRTRRRSAGIRCTACATGSAGPTSRPDPLPEQAAPPEPVPGGTHVVQLLRTYPNLRHGRDYPFARGGERSVARGYGKALARARDLVYIEDQYLWSPEVAEAFVDSLRRSPELRVIAVLPHLPGPVGAAVPGAPADRPARRRRHARARPLRTASRSTASRTTPGSRSTSTPRSA